MEKVGGTWCENGQVLINIFAAIFFVMDVNREILKCAPSCDRLDWWRALRIHFDQNLSSHNDKLFNLALVTLRNHASSVTSWRSPDGNEFHLQCFAKDICLIYANKYVAMRLNLRQTLEESEFLSITLEAYARILILFLFLSRWCDKEFLVNVITSIWPFKLPWAHFCRFTV